MPWEDWRPGEDEPTSAWMRATASSGSAQFEGRVAWSGELGYGVREPEPAQAEADAESGDGGDAQGDEAHDDAHGGH
jgi:NADH-quinone oxidoreductase subunit I